jgi:hypothetical protein
VKTGGKLLENGDGYIPLKRRLTLNGPHGAICQKMLLFKLLCLYHELNDLILLPKRLFELHCRLLEIFPLTLMHRASVAPAAVTGITS